MDALFALCAGLALFGFYAVIGWVLRVDKIPGWHDRRKET